ncbi:GTP cyclohydrolase FolE2 [Halothiobacillus sp. DCM-1]|uniref:GTP cyclohydrolase FolE2 n=1 Tax=Halothiobacillus sp. DCM-1 TaxID=3112558 RepID=UPI0032497FC0
MTACAMPDVQSSRDQRNIIIDQVGIRALRHPIVIQDGERQQASVAECELTVTLPAEQKGTHMSRFVALLNETSPLTLSLASLPQWLERMAERLHATQAAVTFRLPYFVNKAAPVSGQQALMDYQLGLIGHLTPTGVETRIELTVPVTSLCPCSKEISAYGAHNQRSHITVTARVADPTLRIDALIARIEAQGSCQLWGLLKRPDEKFITEYAFDHPKFVEDMIRDVAGTLAESPELNGYRVTVENFESIHNHSAWAIIDRL